MFAFLAAWFQATIEGIVREYQKFGRLRCRRSIALRRRACRGTGNRSRLGSRGNRGHGTQAFRDYSGGAAQHPGFQY